MSVTACFVPVFLQTSKQLAGMCDCMTADKRVINISFLLANSCSPRSRPLFFKLAVLWHTHFPCQNVCMCRHPSQQSQFWIFCSSEVVSGNESCWFMPTISSHCSCRMSFSIESAILFISPSFSFKIQETQEHTWIPCAVSNSGRRPNNSGGLRAGPGLCLYRKSDLALFSV